MLGILAGLGLVVASAQASNIRVDVQGSAGQSAITVEPNGTVNYRIVANLSDTNNEGAALIGLSLRYTGGAIGQQADTPAGLACPNPMGAFVVPDGIGNPAGYGGTMIGGELIQIGGAQNTINNTADNALFPIGAVIPGVAKPAPGCGQAVVATGSFNIGVAEADFEVQAFDVFANVIQAGQDGTGAFWATEAAGVDAGTNLTVHVVAGGVVPNLVSSVPPFTAVGSTTIPTNGTLWRTTRQVIRLTFDGPLPVTPPTGTELDIVELLPAGAFGADLLPGTFQLTIEGGNVLKIRESATGSTVLADNHWYAIRNTGAWAGVANFEIHFPVNVGDSDGNRFTTPADVGQVNAAPNGPQPDNSRFDINGDAFKTPADVGLANANQGPPPAKPTGH